MLETQVANESACEHHVSQLSMTHQRIPHPQLPFMLPMVAKHHWGPSCTAAWKMHMDDEDLSNVKQWCWSDAKVMQKWCGGCNCHQTASICSLMYVDIAWIKSWGCLHLLLSDLSLAKLLPTPVDIFLSFNYITLQLHLNKHKALTTKLSSMINMNRIILRLQMLYLLKCLEIWFDSLIFFVIEIENI